MSKELYQEALADAKQLIEVAETNAKKAIIDQVAPRIRQLIEQHILDERDEDKDDDELLLGDKDVEQQDNVFVDTEETRVNEPMSTLPSSPGDKYPTSPVDLSNVHDDFELSLESTEDVLPVASECVDNHAQKTQLVEQVIDRLGKQVLFHARSVKENKEISDVYEKISETIQLAENMYEYVHDELDVSSDAREKLESKLEISYKDLNKLREHTMSKIRMNEEDLKLVLKGLPELDDESLQGVSVDLVLADEEEQPVGEFTPEEEPEAGEELELPADEQAAPESLDMGEPESEEEEEVKEEASFSMSEMDDDTVIEIDEAMLVREIKKMRALREASCKACEPKIADDFGGGKVDHEAFLDGEVTTEAEKEDDEDVVCDATTCESLKRRLAVEQRTVHSMKSKLSSLKAQAKSTKSPTRREALKEAWNIASERLSLAESKLEKLQSKLQAEAMQHVESSNSDSDQLAELKAENKSLRDKLTEQNLVNAKLLYTNKLLQSEGLSSKQKASIIESLDSAQSLREVKLLYSNLTKTAPTRVSESTERKVIGSASRAVKPASVNTLSEAACEAERWARLAGITK